MSVAIVIPTFNEAANVGRLLERILAVGPEYRAIVVDDNSPDGTAKVVGEIARREPRVQLVLRTADKGFGTSVRAGFAEALRQGVDYVGQMDADGSHDPAVFRDLVKVIEAGKADVMIGSRYLPQSEIQGWNLHRHANSRVANRLTRWVTRLPVADATNGLRLFRRDVLAAMDLTRLVSKGYSVILETNYTAHRLGYRIGELPITFHPREAGESKMGFREVVRFLRFLVGLRFRPIPRAASVAAGFSLRTPSPQRDEPRREEAHAG